MKIHRSSVCICGPSDNLPSINTSNCCTTWFAIQLISVATTGAQGMWNLVTISRLGSYRTSSDTKHPVHTGAMLHRPNYPETQPKRIAVGREPAAQSLSARQLSNTDPGTEPVRSSSNMVGPAALSAPSRIKTPCM